MEELLIQWSSELRISEEKFNLRKNTCLSCQHLRDGGKTCASCGCPTANFWINPDTICPEGKFTPETDSDFYDMTDEQGLALPPERPVNPI